MTGGYMFLRKKFIYILGYIIRKKSISGVSDIKKIETDTKKELFELSIFFDGNRASFGFESEQIAKNIKNRIEEELCK